MCERSLEKPSKEARKKSAFIGLYIDPWKKKAVKKEAKARGTSISEIVRQCLNSSEALDKKD